MLKINDIAKITNAKVIQINDNNVINYLHIDTRKIFFAREALFFAIKGDNHDGHDYLRSAYEKGVRNFIVQADSDHLIDYSDVSILKVENSIEALQQICTYHRSQYSIPVVGITGSNGKTIVKEWLSQLLAPLSRVVKSPNSYNSQVGVPLSLWEMRDFHEIGIFEAGISRLGEMDALESMIKPDIGVLTNIGSAHDEGFSSREEKLNEKLILFQNCSSIVYCADHEVVEKQVKRKYPDKNLFSWSQKQKEANLQFSPVSSGNYRVSLENKEALISLPFDDQASIENALHAITTGILVGYEIDFLIKQSADLHAIGMRLQAKEGVLGSVLIDDTYNHDLGGLKIALQYMRRYNKQRKTVILSDLLQSGLLPEELYSIVAEILKEEEIDHAILIGNEVSGQSQLFSMKTDFFSSVDEFLGNYDEDWLRDSVVLIKGARKFRFEHILSMLESKAHRTHLEVSLDALTHNYFYYKSLLKPETKIMVMVKAFAYGSGSMEVAQLLQFHRADYLAVAYADEGVDLRKQGISLPIMVMNPTAEDFRNLIDYHLEPEIYSIRLLKDILEYSRKVNTRIPVHLKIDTGMHRLGFESKEEIEEACELINQSKTIIKSVFTHLAGADDTALDDFSGQQFEQFDTAVTLIKRLTNQSFITHALNTAGIARFAGKQMDMVRLGLGLYGIDGSSTVQPYLKNVITLKTVVSQVREVKAGETIGYNRKGKVDQDSKIATLAIGYADGYDRRNSNGVGKVLINGKIVPVIGNVCMDMCMVDVTGLELEEGDEAIVLGADLTVLDQAKALGTIPYEILTGISERVKRIYSSE